MVLCIVFLRYWSLSTSCGTQASQATRKSKWIGHLAQTYKLFWWITLLERTVCQVVNALLVIAAPISISINPPETQLVLRSRGSIISRVWTPLSQVSILTTLITSIRFAFVALIIFYSDEEIALSSMSEPYMVSVLLPVVLDRATLFLPIVCEIIFRVDQHKDPVDALITSLLGAGALLSVIGIYRTIAEDPHRLADTWASLRTVVKTVHTLTGRDVVTLQAYVENSRKGDSISPAGMSFLILPPFCLHVARNLRVRK
jgi:hypothetical protein